MNNAGLPAVLLRLGFDGPIIGTATLAEDGTVCAEVTDTDAVAALSAPSSGISLRFSPARHERRPTFPRVVVDERVPPGVIALASEEHIIAYRQDTGTAAETRRDGHGQWSQPQPVDDQQAPTVEVTTSEPDAALYFVCQNRHPLAARTTTATVDGERRAVHHEVVCPACEADGITEVRLPDLDDEGDDE